MRTILKKIFFIAFSISSLVGFSDNFTPQEYLTKSEKFLNTNFDSSIVYANYAIRLAKKDDYSIITQSYKNIGLAHYFLGNHPLALLNFQKALKIAEEHKLYKEQALLYNALGTFYKKQNNLKLALEAFKNESVFAMQIKDSSLMASALNDIGLVYELQNNNEDAIKNFNDASDIYISVKDSIGLSYSLNYLGEIYSYQKQFDLAIDALKKALTIRENLNDSIGIAVNLNNIGEVYLLQNNNISALDYFFKSLVLSKSLNYTDLTKHTYKFISEVYRSQKNYEQAYYYYDLHVALKDSIFNQQNARLINEMEAKYQNEKKQLQIDNLNKENTIKETKLHEQAAKAKFLYIGAGLLCVIILIIILAYRNKQNANKIISSQKLEVEIQRDLIQAKSKEVTDSIYYARRIQRALLASNSLLQSNLPEHFVLYKPKDIVSGDFYWASLQGNKFYLCSADCTGHGVPGAFMSLLNISFLNEAVIEKKIESPDKILNEVRSQIISSLSSGDIEEQTKDGMDAVLCMFDFKGMWLRFSCANNPLWLIRNNELKVFAADKMPVGMHHGEEKPFTLQTIGLRKGDIVYLFTDGYSDQFGGEHGKKFKYKKLQELLLDIREKTMQEQKEILDATIEQWRRDLEQVDDMLIIGIKV